jgi:hypothetical protein
MTKLKLLSAALIAAATLATPAMARESGVASRRPAEQASANTAFGARYTDGRLCTPAPAVGAFATQPWNSGPPCEPAPVNLSDRVVDRPRRSLPPGGDSGR